MVRWTEQQIQAISLRDTDILVSAAAGSGKTATLIERIVSILSDESSGTACENLLVTTFTNAAAGEIRERVRKALRQKMQQFPENTYLKKQYRNISRATISTLHSFCSDIIRKNASLIDIDPDFYVADETISDRFLQDSVHSIYQAKLDERNESFTKLLATFGYGKNFASLTDMIIGILKTSKSFPDYEQWLQNSAKKTVLNEENIFNSDYGVEIKKHILRKLKASEAYICYLTDVLDGSDQAEHYQGIVEEDIATIDSIYEALETNDWNHIKGQLDAISYSSLPRKKKDFPEELVDSVKNYRYNFKSAINEIRAQFYDFECNIHQDCEYMYPIIKEFTETILSVDDKYSKAKQKAKLIDYSDMEHMALKCLKAGAAETYREKFKHILIDEYQDFNYIQEEIINLISKKNNVFAVGDLKQSIYRFRNAQTAIFRNKATQFQNSTQKGCKLSLSYNFRSRDTILDYVNNIFSNTMNEDLGEVEYSDDERLMFGATYYTSDIKEKQYQPQIIKIGYEKGLYQGALSTVTALEAEAYIIGGEIRKLVESKMLIYDGDLKNARPIKYSDIVILLRSVNPYAKKYCETLNQFNISAYSEQSVDFFQDESMKFIYALLNVTDNPYQDIFLAEVMKNRIYGFNEKELAVIKNSRYGLYKDLQNYNANENLKLKIQRLLEDLSSIRDFSKKNTIEKTVYFAMTKSGIYYVSDNQDLLKRFYTLSAECLKKGISDLSGFLEFIKSKKKRNIDIMSDILKTPSTDAVRIMSIHKSKGLEFPVVILSGCSRNFNLEDTKRRLLIDRDLGFGSEYINDINMTHHKHITKNALITSIKRQNLSEEMRILYVALTRAKEKLIVTGIDPGNSTALVPDDAKNYFDWILPRTNSYLKTSVSAEECVEYILDIKSNQREVPSETLGCFDVTYLQDIMKRLAFEYPFIEETILNRKISATELAKYQSKNYGIEEFYNQYKVDVKKKPAFLEAKSGSLSATEKGTMMHKIMASINLKKLHEPEYVSCIKAKIQNEEFLNNVIAFISTPIFNEIWQADQVYQERVFFMPVNTSYISSITGQEFKKEHTVIMQGVIDCLCVKDGKGIIIDYKTDRLKPGLEVEVALKYKTQLDIYAKAVEDIMGIKIVGKVIHFFETNTNVDLNLL